MSSASRRRAAGGEYLHRQEVFVRGGGHSKPGMVEDALGRGISARGDVDACLLIEPPGWQSEFLGDGAGFVQHDAVGLEDCVDVAGGRRAS